MMKKLCIKTICFLIVILFILPFLYSCGQDNPNDAQGITPLSFSGTSDIGKIQELDGQTVTITGYMSTLSPLNGKYMYLMNLPYQSCPFCKPNTSELSNTLAVYAGDGKKYEYTDLPIKVTGKIEVGNYTDDFGYEYNYRIVDGSFVTVDLSKSDNEKTALWYSIASDGLAADIYTMFDYVYFVTHWPEYYIPDENGGIQFYFYPSDAVKYLEDDKFGYAVQNSEGYFETLTDRIKAISSTELTELEEIVLGAQKLVSDALKELDDGNYTYTPWESHEGEFIYSLNKKDELSSRYESVYGRFYIWLSNWEI